MNKFSHNSNAGFSLAIGVAVGSAIGLAFHNIAIGSALAAALSLIFFSSNFQTLLAPFPLSY